MITKTDMWLYTYIYNSLRVEAGHNTSAVALQIAEGDEPSAWGYN